VRKIAAILVWSTRRDRLFAALERPGSNDFNGNSLANESRVRRVRADATRACQQILLASGDPGGSIWKNHSVGRGSAGFVKAVAAIDIRLAVARRKSDLAARNGVANRRRGDQDGS
jgi:hypothetical protein